jgi:hypothetical protein
METPRIQVAHRGTEAKWQSKDTKTTMSAHWETRGDDGTLPEGCTRLLVLVLAGEVRTDHAKHHSDMRIEVNAEVAAALCESIAAINKRAYTPADFLDESAEFSSSLAGPQNSALRFGVRVKEVLNAAVHEAFLSIHNAGGEIEIRFENATNLSHLRSFVQRGIAG